jgi:hypothetical protein
MIPACSGGESDDTTCESGFDCYGTVCADLTTVGDGNCDDQNLCDMLDNDGGDCGDVETGNENTGDSGSSWACDGACDPEDAKYNACTCGTDDPCGWINDQYCDDYCTESFPENHFDDSNDCPECGNGAVHGDEECDTAGETAACDDDCTEVACGDGNVNEAAGEVCDDGANDACGECNEDCTAAGTEPCPGDEPDPAVCGNGTLEDGEVCDDGYTDACGTCNADCSGVGAGATCGDGQVCPQLETCDDGTVDACGECNADCSGPGEECPEVYEPCADKVCGDTCTVCDPADTECIETEEIKVCDEVGACVSDTGDICAEEEVAYDPCADKVCGDTCSACDPADTDCVETAEIKVCDEAGSCVSDTGSICAEEEVAYDPCAAKACGDMCTLCDPADLDCVETAVVKVCDDAGTCVTDTGMACNG